MAAVQLFSAGAEGLEARGPGRAVYVSTAAQGLADAAAITAPDLARLKSLGFATVELDLARASPAETQGALAGADLLFVGGGDPFRLLREAAHIGFGETARAALARGVAYAGVSAGAMAAAPDLTPVAVFSPFRPQPGQALAGWGLVPLLVLPHDDRPGRRALHEETLRRHGGAGEMLALSDGEWTRLEDGLWRLHARGVGVVVRPAVADDAAGIAAAYLAAARAAWAGFLGEEAMAGLQAPAGAWAQRLTDPSGETFVAEDGEGVLGFVWIRTAADPDLGAEVGEVAAFYTHPRAWGRGAGRRLLDLALDRLRARGAAEAALWTEARNARPRRIYEQAGWRQDGAVRERVFLGQPLRELRHRLAL